MMFRKAILIALTAILSVIFSTNDKIEAWDDLWYVLQTALKRPTPTNAGAVAL